MRFNDRLARLMLEELVEGENYTVHYVERVEKGAVVKVAQLKWMGMTDGWGSRGRMPMWTLGLEGHASPGAMSIVGIEGLLKEKIDMTDLFTATDVIEKLKDELETLRVINHVRGNHAASASTCGHNECKVAKDLRQQADVYLARENPA